MMAIYMMRKNIFVMFQNRYHGLKGVENTQHSSKGSSCRAVVSGGAGGAWNLEVLLTLFQPDGADYVHHITASTPGFENLTTSLNWSLCCCLRVTDVKSGKI
jgi:hypothetical protein